MGEVFEVAHPTLPRHEAIKLLDSALSSDPSFKSRFLHEADVMARLAHPNVVTIFDRGDDGGRMWLAMEMVDGTDAGQLLRHYGCMRPDLALDVIAGAGTALDYAWHSRRITHRDVKPANILVKLGNAGRAETVKLADFGIAKASGGSTKLTATGLTIGTLTYMAPEALEGHDLDGFTDQYSLGCTAFELLTGTPPFTADTSAAIVAGHLSRPVPPVTHRRPDLPPQLDGVFQRVLSKQPGHRYGSCGEFVDAMRGAFHQAPMGATTPAAAFTSGVPQRSTRTRPAVGIPGRTRRWHGPKIAAAAAAVLLVLVGAAVYVARSSNRSASESTRAASTGTASSLPTVTALPEIPLDDLVPKASSVQKIMGLTFDRDPYVSQKSTDPISGTTNPQSCGVFASGGADSLTGYSDVRSTNYRSASGDQTVSLEVARYSGSPATEISALGSPEACSAFTTDGLTGDGQSVAVQHTVTTFSPVGENVTWAVTVAVAKNVSATEWAGHSSAVGCKGNVAVSASLSRGAETTTTAADTNHLGTLVQSILDRV